MTKNPSVQRALRQLDQLTDRIRLERSKLEKDGFVRTSIVTDVPLYITSLQDALTTMTFKSNDSYDN